MLFKANPDAVKEWDRDGSLPLHIALCPVRASNAVKEMFFMHTALEVRPSDAVIGMLLNAHPDAAKKRDGNGRQPLHAALEVRASDALIEMLLKAHTYAAKERDGNGWLPLHRALRDRASDAIIEMLFKENPDAVKTRSGNGWQPLHRVLVGASVAVIEMIIKADPDVAYLSTKIGIAWLARSLSQKPASDKFHDLFCIVSSGATTLGALESATSALMAMRLGDERLNASLSMLRVWHHGGMMWKMCIKRTVGQILPEMPAHIISAFVCGKCACELCCRPRP
eukprot:NODE_7980_length_1533_cov_3.870555.p1 GENE.NODE_7980_length_1533_cov_3.870555~~NODE_7980_length_1533_cov_3.870555.p1  ORF type:complete len:282 (+),score=37.93 NODE_7980_length_1533_cov_3.870555:560-1405(+)